MSAFLGPIHYWLYNKIQLQESLTESITEYDKTIDEKLDKLCGTVERRPLEEVIDTANIHGWLQGQIEIAETRFALAVTTLLNVGVNLDDIKLMARKFGSTHPLLADTAPEVFKQLGDLLLDGMPCDHVNQVTEQDDEKVVWMRTTDIHKPHWDKADGDISNYYALRSELILGMLQESGFSFHYEDNTFTVKKN